MTLRFHHFNTIIIFHTLLSFIYIHVFLDTSRNKKLRMQRQYKQSEDNDP